MIDGTGQASVTFKLRLKDDKGDYHNVDPYSAAWKIDEQPQPPATSNIDFGLLTNDGQYIAPSLPSPNLAQLHITVTALDEKGRPNSIRATVKFTLKWLPDWPYLAELPGIPWTKPWGDATGQRAALLLYDLLSQLPQSFLATIKEVPILRSDQVSGSFHFPLPVPFVVIDDEDIQLLPDSLGALPSGPAPSDEEKNLEYTFFHELAHACLTYQCSVDEDILKTALWGILHVFVDAVAYQATSIATAIFALPLLPAVMMGGFFMHQWLERDLSRPDFMSDYASSIGWKTNNWTAMSVPFIGLIWPLIGKEPPNVFTAFKDFGKNFFVNLRNPPLETELKTLSSSPTMDELQKVLIATESVSWYGTTDPHEDWAEACSERVFSAAQMNTFIYNFPACDDMEVFVPINDARRSMVEMFLPSSWAGATFGGTLGTFSDWEVDYSKPQRALASVNVPEYKLLHEQLRQWNEGHGATIARVQKILEGMRMPEGSPQTIDFLRTTELHGEGLRRYRGMEQEAALGDLLVARDENVWMVVRTDEASRIAQVTGAVEVSPSTNPADLKLERETLIYHWQPSSQPRRWLKDGEEVSAAYRDIEATLTTLVGLWGLEATEQKRSVNSMGAFFAEALRVAGIEAADFPLAAEPGLLDIKGFCQTHGAGLRVYEPGAFPVRVGDWVLFYHENLWGVVTRVREGLPVDVLVGGSVPDDLVTRNTYQEVIGHDLEFTVKLLHEIDAQDVQYHWRPSAELRTLTETTTEIWKDLNRGLNNLLAHVDAESIMRQEKRVPYQVDPLLTLFRLMLEKGASTQGLEAFKELSLSASHDGDLWDYIYSHGNPTGATAPAQPGDLISWLRGNTRRQGVVIETDGGVPTKVIGGEDRVTLYEERVAPEAVTDLWTPSSAPRVHAESDLAEFYGSPSLLFEMTAQCSELKVLKRAGQEFALTDPLALAQALASNSPAWVRERLREANDLEQLQDAVATLGAGLRDGASGPLAVGAWCFLKGGRFAAVLSVSPTGEPLKGLSAGAESLIFAEVKRSEIQHVWLPSAKPFAYTSTATAAYADLNALIGLLRFWGALKVEMEHPLFNTPDLNSYFDPKLAKFLKRGPIDEEDWPDYLSGLGQPVDLKGVQPGDFLLLAGHQQAIALDNSEMIVRQNSHLYLRALAKTGKRWPPVVPQK